MGSDSSNIAESENKEVELDINNNDNNSIPRLMDPDNPCYYSSDDSSLESDCTSFQTDSDYLPPLIDQDQQSISTTSVTVTSSQSEIIVPWDNYDQLEVENYSLQYDQPDWYTDNNLDKDDEQLISQEDLDMVAHTFYLRKREMEEVSYLDPVEDETVFYDCHLEPE